MFTGRPVHLFLAVFDHYGQDKGMKSCDRPTNEQSVCNAIPLPLLVAQKYRLTVTDNVTRFIVTCITCYNDGASLEIDWANSK